MLIDDLCGGSWIETYSGFLVETRYKLDIDSRFTDEELLSRDGFKNNSRSGDSLVFIHHLDFG